MDPKPVNWDEMTQQERQTWLDLQNAKKHLPKNDKSLYEELNSWTKKNQKKYIDNFPKGKTFKVMPGSPNMAALVDKKKALQKAASKKSKIQASPTY